ncbi:Gar1/Naf1 RNA binding region-domain-containing protein [Paraphysoderma sedebokerense]|nr:Gar1/Naf1 RNA binding region-domain-containing protein [Paraphysoderma sedebokerense]
MLTIQFSPFDVRFFMFQVNAKQTIPNNKKKSGRIRGLCKFAMRISLVLVSLHWLTRLDSTKTKKKSLGKLDIRLLLYTIPIRSGSCISFNLFKMTVEQIQIQPHSNANSNSNSNSETPHTDGPGPTLVPSTETVQPLSADSGMVSSKDTDTSMTIQNDMEINLYDDLISGDDMLGECDQVGSGNDGMDGQVKIGGGLDNVKEDSGDEKVNGDKPVESRDGDVVMSEEFTKERSNQEEEESSDDSSDDWSDDSSDESSSESDTSSSESESESEEEDEDVDMEIKGGKQIKDLTIDSDDEVGGETLKTKNEVAKLPPVEPLDITITPDMTLSKIGTIFAFVEDLVVIQADKKPDIGDYQALDETSVLVFEDRSILGAVFETFGPVSQPLYSVRFNSGEEVKEKLGTNAEKGKAVFFVENLSKFVYTASLKALKGSDASNQYDEEVGEEVLFRWLFFLLINFYIDSIIYL